MITYSLFARQLGAPRGFPSVATPKPPPFLTGRSPDVPDLRERISAALAQQRADALHQLLTQSAVALAIVSVIAVALGWVVAGRVLRPLRDITTTARRLSTHNLDERINLPGPRDELKEADAVRTAVTDARPTALERDLRITTRLDPGPVRGDAALLERLAANLVDNAVRHNVPGGWIEVRTSVDGAATTLWVANSGPIVPADGVEALFEPFRRPRPDGGLKITVRLPASVREAALSGVGGGVGGAGPRGRVSP